MTGGAPDDDRDDGHMRAALALARRHLGQTWPNPSVGCVLVRDGRVVGRGVTAPGGRPHAEVLALAAAGAAARGATAYVTLEPCSHHGKTPPCADALIAAGVTRAVVGCNDPDPRVNGAGLARLRAAGIEVVENVLRAEAESLQIGFITRVRLGRPAVTLKLATTLDGRIATAGGDSQWITGAAARRAGHGLRGTHDAVLVGVGTVLADDPALTCRIAGFRRVPAVRVVLDGRLRTPLTSQLATTAQDVPTWLLHGPEAPAAARAALAALGVRLIEVEGGEGRMAAALAALGAAGLTRVLAEGGAGVAGALLGAGLVDGIAWFHAPGVMGGDGLAAATEIGVRALAEMPRFRRVAVRGVGADVWTELERAPDPATRVR